MQNGPFGPRGPAFPLIQKGEDITRPLTRTYESNRGGSKTLTPEWRKNPDKFGTFRAKEVQLPIDVRTDGTNAERMSVATGLSRPHGIDENNNPRPFVLPSCTPNPVITNGLFWPHVVGRVEWGTGQAALSANFDWHHGTELSVVSESIRIYARYEVTVPPWANLTCADLPNFTTLLASAALGYGVAREAPTLTKIAQLEFLDQTQTIKIPPYAKSVTVLPSFPTFAGVSGVAATVQALGQGYAFPIPFGLEGQPVPLFNGADTIVVRNVYNPVSQPMFAFLVFELAL